LNFIQSTAYEIYNLIKKLNVNEIKYHIEKLKKSLSTTGHFGVCKIFDLINSNFRWPKLRNDVKKFVKFCETCCKANLNNIII